ncbi:MFS transporter [Pseudodonghicola flavimaris]|uniref:MFS transporter n=1 Tax=Pseudodonghicola flavimaris TaxID=3050036 RepID=A0ABT7F836_9RHOB|nr:MFS transporter [Pseudodonghicola flavimaris]MDK3020772.1 MFS transporter [Pseudodonghicola flavimaris]
MNALSPASQPSYRWVIVTAAAVMLAIAMGTLVNGLSAFLVPLEAHFGWARAEVAAINSAGLIGIALGGIVLGLVADRVPARLVCLLGAGCLSLSLLLAAQAQHLWQFYALFFAAGALGGGALYAPVIALVGSWFRHGAGLAIGLASAGQALGQGLVPYAAGYLIQMTDWQTALTLLAVFSAISLIPLSFLMIAPPKQDGPAGTIREEETAPQLSPRIVLPALSLAVLGCCAGMAVPLMHLVPLIQGVCSVGAEAGGPLLLMLIAAIGGRIFFGKLADMIGPMRSWLVATGWQTLLMLGFLLLGSIQSFWLFTPIYGFGYGGVMTGVLVTVRALAPASHRASATGFVLAFGWLGHALGGFQGGYFFDITGAYFWTFANATLFGLVNLAIIGGLFLATRPRTRAAT